MNAALMAICRSAGVGDGIRAASTMEALAVFELGADAHVARVSPEVVGYG
jgi:hypothetical protein